MTEAEGPVKLKLCLANCMPCGSPKGMDPADTIMQQNPTWRRRVTGDPTGIDKYASLPVNVEEWGPDVVMQWMDMCGMSKMKNRLKGLSGKELLALRRDDVTALTVKNPMDCFVFSAHLGELRKRTMMDADPMLETPFATPRFGVVPSVAGPGSVGSLGTTPRFVHGTHSSPSNPLGLPQEYLHSKLEKVALSVEGDTMEASLKDGIRDSSEVQTIEVSVKASGQTLEDMVREVLSEQVKTHDPDSAASSDSNDSVSSERAEAALQTLMMRASASKEELREALAATLWQPHHASSDDEVLEEEMRAAQAAAEAHVVMARALADQVAAEMGDVVTIGTVTVDNSGITNSFRQSTDTTIIRQSTEVADLQNPADVEDDLVPIREKFPHSPITTPAKPQYDDVTSHVVADEELLGSPIRSSLGSGSLQSSAASFNMAMQGTQAQANRLQSPHAASEVVYDSAEDVLLQRTLSKGESDDLHYAESASRQSSKAEEQLSAVMKAAEAAADSAAEVALRAVTPFSEEGSPVSTPKRDVVEDGPQEVSELALVSADVEQLADFAGTPPLRSPQAHAVLCRSPSAQNFCSPRARDSPQWRSDPSPQHRQPMSPILAMDAAMDELVSVCAIGDSGRGQSTDLRFPADGGSGDGDSAGGGDNKPTEPPQGSQRAGGGSGDDSGGGRDGSGQRIFGVPSLPELYVHRPEIFDTAKREVLAGNSVAILGMDSLLGIGTTTLAAAVARDEEVAKLHDGGVFWLNCRDGADDRSQLEELTDMMADAGYEPPTRPELPGADYFAQALDGRRALLVLDDNPRYAAARMFLEFGFRLVVMSRDQAMPHQLGVHTVVVPVVERDQAARFLALAGAAGRRLLGEPGAESAAGAPWEELALCAGGLPMELEMMARLSASLPSKAAVKKVGRKITDGFRLPEFTGATGGSAHWQALIRTMSVSVDTLPISKHGLYKALAILQPGVSAPISFLSNLWNIEGSEEERHGKALKHARTLHAHGLLELVEPAAREGAAAVRLHDLHSHFLVTWAGKNLVGMHNALLSAYRKGETSFSLVADDGYYMQHVATHLIAAGREPQLRMMLFDVAWLEAKFARYGLWAVLSDFGLYLQGQEDEEVKLLMQALELSAPAALGHPNAPGLLCTQASCRLLSQRAQHGGLSRWIRGVRERHGRALDASGDGVPTMSAGPACLWTRSGSLVQAGGSLLKTLSSYSSAPTKCMSITPDGSLLLTIEGRVSRLWDVATGGCTRVLEGFKDSLMNGALSPDGTYAVTIADHKGEDIGRVWDCSTGRCLHVLEGHADLIQDLVISADSRLALTASYDHTAALWSLVDGSRLHTLTGHTDYVESAAISKDSTRAVTGSWDMTARIWDIATGACLHVLEGHGDRVWRIALGSQYLVTTSWDMTACVWEVESGEGVWQLEGHTDVVHSAAITEDEQWVVTASQDGTARVWDIQVGKCCQVLTGQAGTGKMAVSPDGRKAVALSDSSDALAQVWDLRTGACVRNLEGHGAKISGLALTADGNRAVTVSWDRTARLWDLSAGDADGEELSHQGSVSAICLQDGCDTILSSAADRTARMWACINAQPLYTLAPAGLAAALLGGLGLAASIAADGQLRLWDLENGECVQATQLDGDLESVSAYAAGPATPRESVGARGSNVPERPTCLLAAGDNLLVSCLASGTVEVWLVGRQKRRASIIAQLEHETPVSMLAVSANGTRAATVCGSDVHLWDTMDGELLGVLPFGDVDGIAGVAVSADGGVVVAAGWGNTATIWDGNSLQIRHHLSLGDRSGTLLSAQPKHTAAVSLVVSADGLRVATSSSCGVVELWDLESGSTLRQFQRTLPVSALAMSATASYITACAQDGSLVLWDTAAPADQVAGVFFGDAPLRCCAIRTHCTLTDADVVGEVDLCISAGDANGQVHALSF